MELRSTTYDEKLLHILRGAAAMFAAKGYHRASIRDISASTEVSLSGLYYYFKSKEELLFLIQDHCFGTLQKRLSEELDGLDDPAQRLRVFVRNHLRFFLANRAEMKVLSHEADALSGEYRATIQQRKRDYSAVLSDLLTRLAPPGGLEVRTATFALFGMLNWVYTWYRPEIDPDADALAERMTQLFLRGFLCSEGEVFDLLPEPLADGDDAPSIWRTT